VELYANELPAMKSRINYSANITPARVFALRSIPQSERDLFSIFPIKKIDNASTTVLRAKTLDDDDRSRREISSFRRRISRYGSANGIIIRVLRSGIFLFCRARMKHSVSFARKLHAPFSDARRALSPCVESGMDTVFAVGIIV